MPLLSLFKKKYGNNFTNDLYRDFVGFAFDGVIGLLDFEIRDLDFDCSRDFETAEWLIYDELSRGGISCFLEMFRDWEAK